MIELEPNFYDGYQLLGQVYLSNNRLEEALQQAELAVNLHNNGITLGVLGTVYGMMGEKSKALEVLEKMENLKSIQWVGDYEISTIYFTLREFDLAFHFLEQAIDRKEGNLFFFKYFVSDLHALRLAKDPRTEQILIRLGLPY